MTAQNIRTFALSAFASMTLFACASNVVFYEPPTSGPMSKITVVNAADNQDANLVTFDDGIYCTGKRSVRFDSEKAIPAGQSRFLTVAAGRELALFATLPTIESDEYGVDLGVTSGLPSPVVSRTVTAIGCNARISFSVEPGNDYHIEISEPRTSDSCSIEISKADNESGPVAIETKQRIVRYPRDPFGPYCEPLAD